MHMDPRFEYVSDGIWIYPCAMQVSITAEARSKLFGMFISSLPSASPPTELLYGAAALLQDGTVDSPALVSLL